MKTILLSLASATILSLSASTTTAASLDPAKLPPASGKQGVTFVQDIQPIFAKACLECHGAKKPKENVRLDSLEAALKSGKKARVVEPGNSGQSLLLYAVAHAGGKAMPPKGKGAPLTQEQVGLVRAWIDQGAK
jgi:cytochrome c5